MVLDYLSEKSGAAQSDLFEDLDSPCESNVLVSSVREDLARPRCIVPALT